MTWFFFILFVSFLSVTIVIIQQTSSVSTNDQKNLKPDESVSFLDNHSWITDKSQETVDQLRCPGNWSRFNYSCYSLSDIWSTAKQANHTCNLFQLNNSRLMYIQHPIELFYAAHVLAKNDLNKLVLEVDQDLMKDAKIINLLSSNDDVQQEEFRKRILPDTSYHDKTINRESTTVAGDQINNDNKGHNKLKNVDYLHKPCRQIKWNVVNEDSNTLILTVELGSKESICSLSNADLRIAYPHLCQYVLDRCLNNMICGKHGRCINSQSSFNCECSFLYDGLFCEKYSNKNIQIIIGIIIIVFSVFFTYPQLRKAPFDAIQWFINRSRQQPPTQNNRTGPPSNETVEWPSVDPEKDKNEFKLTKKEQGLRKIFLGIFTIVFLLVFFKFPPNDHVKLTQLNDTNLSKIDSLINDNVHLVEQYKRYTILRTDNFILLFVSGLLVTIFSILNKREKRDEDDDRSGIVEPIKLLRITDRWSTTTIIVIQMFEILGVLEETVIDIDESAPYGIFAQIVKRIFFVILIALRYYPTLSSLQFQNFFVRLLIIVYFLGSMVYMTLYGSSGMHWLLVLMKVLPSTQKSVHIDLSSWSFSHGFTRNILHYFLIGYICAELIMRLFYDSIHIAWKRGRTIWDIPHRTIDQYSFHADRKKKCFIRNLNDNPATGENSDAGNANVDQQGCWNSIRQCANSIYEWNNDFRFTTIAISTYTVAFIFLLHLTGTVILLYKTQTNSFIRYIKHIFELILNIEVKEWSFQGEVIVSAIITMIIYGIQLFLSIKNYRKNMRDLYTKFSEDPELGRKLKKREIIRKSTQYPSYLLLYLLGGFFICFHLILLFSVTIKDVIFTHIGSSKGAIGYIIPILVLYLLQKMIIRWLHKIFDYFDQRKETDLDWKLNIFDSILLYLKLISGSFIGIIASIIRLIFSVLVNIIFMPRIDYSYLVEPLKSLDSAHESFNSFLRLEILFTNPLILDFSSSVQPISNAAVPPNETTAVVHQEEYQDAVNNQNLDDHTSTSEQQSPVSQHRSLNRAYEPIPPNVTLADDEDLRRAFI